MSTGVWYQCWPTWPRWEPQNRPSMHCAASMSSAATKNPSCLKCLRWGGGTVAKAAGVIRCLSKLERKTSCLLEVMTMNYSLQLVVFDADSGGFWVCAVIRLPSFSGKPWERLHWSDCLWNCLHALFYVHMCVLTACSEVPESRVGQLHHLHCGIGTPGPPVSWHLCHRDEEHRHQSHCQRSADARQGERI